MTVSHLASTCRQRSPTPWCCDCPETTWVGHQELLAMIPQVQYLPSTDLPIAESHSLHMEVLLCAAHLLCAQAPIVCRSLKTALTRFSNLTPGWVSHLENTQAIAAGTYHLSSWTLGRQASGKASSESPTADHGTYRPSLRAREDSRGMFFCTVGLTSFAQTVFKDDQPSVQWEAWEMDR